MFEFWVIKELGLRMYLFFFKKKVKIFIFLSCVVLCRFLFKRKFLLFVLDFCRCCNKVFFLFNLGLKGLKLIILIEIF